MCNYTPACCRFSTAGSPCPIDQPVSHYVGFLPSGNVLSDFQNNSEDHPIPWFHVPLQGEVRSEIARALAGDESYGRLNSMPNDKDTVAASLLVSWSPSHDPTSRSVSAEALALEIASQLEIPCCLGRSCGSKDIEMDLDLDYRGALGHSVIDSSARVSSSLMKGTAADPPLVPGIVSDLGLSHFDNPDADWHDCVMSDEEMNDCLNSDLLLPEGPPYPAFTPVGHNLSNASNIFRLGDHRVIGASHTDCDGGVDDGVSDGDVS